MKVKNTRFIALGFMLFALLFGAGNLIFPAAMGQASGTNVWHAVAGFCLTGVGLPLLGVTAMGYSGCEDLQQLASRVHPWYGVFYTVTAYLTIGPCFAAPRTGTVSFEIAVKPFLDASVYGIAEPISLFLFFAATYWFSATPSRLVDRIGKILTPALLFVILLLIVKSVITPLGVPVEPLENYATPGVAFSQGLLEGYNTLDAIASFVFASLVIAFLREDGITEKREITISVLKCGLVAAAALAFIYAFIARIGADSVTLLGRFDTGAPLLARASQVLFGTSGAMILAVIVLFACLSTSIGLVTCCAGYFVKLVGRLSYRTWVVIFSIASYLVALFGLKTIITAAVPVLMFVYPLAVILIALAFLHNFFDGRRCVYAWTAAFTFVIAVANLLEAAGVLPEAALAALRHTIPLYGAGMGWVPFASVGFAAGLLWTRIFPCTKTS